jgi:DNA-binding CsgD family transcriptional regulator
VKWRLVVLFAMVILSRPLCLLWQSYYLRNVENTSVLIGISVFLDLITLLACALLGANRLRGILSAAFVYSIITVTQIPVVYFLALVVQPLLNTPSLLEASAQTPQLYYFGLFMNNIVIASCCFLAAYWLRKNRINLTLKQCILYCLFFISFAVIILVWWSDIAKIISIPFLTSAILGILLLGILLMALYFFIKVTSGGKNENAYNETSVKYEQYIKNLSKRELEVIKAVLAGCNSYKEIAASLNISVHTVKKHLRRIYQITGTSNTAAVSNLFNGY